MKKIILSVNERAILGTLLPTKGSRIEITVIDSLYKLIDFSVEEIQLYRLRNTPMGIVSDDPKNLKDTEYDILEPHIEILKQIEPRLEVNKGITRAMLPLLDKIRDL